MSDHENLKSVLKRKKGIWTHSTSPFFIFFVEVHGCLFILQTLREGYFPLFALCISFINMLFYYFFVKKGGYYFYKKLWRMHSDPMSNQYVAVGRSDVSIKWKIISIILKSIIHSSYYILQVLLLNSSSSRSSLMYIIVKSVSILKFRKSKVKCTFINGKTVLIYSTWWRSCGFKIVNVSLQIVF